ncbi:tyrosine-type recombinase/integrase [Papillibacter cinnamivorans]|uniref:tyrosine-type recombinase/integrase n=1 Tax=Papillibacter cinnamivorans TaxID=100176 RepID=UPI000A06CFB9|nr:tyrosine-type recombinase/integrase [Papillibacter cinnamivorans]
MAVLKKETKIKRQRDKLEQLFNSLPDDKRLASLLLNEGCELYEIKELLGHSQIATTADIYGHLDFKAKKKMSEKMNELLKVAE